MAQKSLWAPWFKNLYGHLGTSMNIKKLVFITIYKII